MSLSIILPADPVSLAAQEGSARASLIESDASRLVTSELRRYCRGEITGRSILVAGHRGGGKTTLVLGAYTSALREAENPGHLRPLLVMLHGPSLLPAEPQLTHKPGGGNGKPVEEPDLETASAALAEQEAEAETPSNNGADSGEVPADEPATPDPTASPKYKSETQIALEQITVGLYRALARELTREFRRRALLLETLRGPEEEPAPPTWLEREKRLLAGSRSPPPLGVAEMAAQLELDLYQNIDPSRLRMFWEAARAHELGVVRHGLPPGKDQGWRELVALVSANEAYLRCTGTLKQGDVVTNTEKLKRDSERKWEAVGEQLVRPLVTLLSGGLAGAAGLATDSGLLTSGFAALLGAFAAAGTLKFTTSTSQDRTRTTTFNFVPNTDVSTLDRVLPILVDRLNAAGFAPLFVVDELDKVDDLSLRMTRLVHDLKKFVAENAFFCWLTDRKYFEEVEAGLRSLAYARESTYFSYRLFIGFWPDDLHAYIGQVLKAPPEPEPPAAPEAPPDPEAPVTPPPEATRPRSVVEEFAGLLRRAGLVPRPAGALDQPEAEAGSAASAPPPASAPLQAYEQATRDLAEDRRDLEVWGYVLKHRSQMHPIDLHRELSAIRGSDGRVLVPPGRVRSTRAYQADVFIQLAIEMVLDQCGVRPWFGREPMKRRFVYDALYFFSRRWWSGTQRIDLGAGGQKDFENYLQERLKTEEEKEVRKDEEAGNHGQGVKRRSLTVEEIFKRVLTEEDRNFLFGLQRQLAVRLTYPHLFRAAFRRWIEERSRQGRPPIPKALLEGLPLSRRLRDMPLERVGARVFGKAKLDTDGYWQFRWRYDSAEQQRAAAMLGGAPKVSSPPMAVRGSGQQPNWLVHVRGIRAVADLLARL